MAVTNEQVFNWLQANPTATDAQIVQAAAAAGVSAEQLSQVTGVPVEQVVARASTAAPTVELPSTAAAPSTEPWDYDKYVKGLKSGNTDFNQEFDKLGGMMGQNAKNIYREILAQQNAGTASAWSKGNTASPQAAAADFALRLAENGIGSLNQLGQLTIPSDGEVPEQQITINKATGQPLPRAELLGRGQRGLDIDYQLDFAPDGTAVPYTTNRSSSWMQFREDTLKPAAMFVGSILAGEALSGALGGTGPGYYDEITGQFIRDANGGLLNPLTNATSGTNIASMSGYSYDPLTQAWTMPDGTQVTSLTGVTNGAVSGADLLANAGAATGATANAAAGAGTVAGAGAGTTAGAGAGAGAGAATGLTNTQIGNLVKAGVGLLGTGAAVGAVGGGNNMAFQAPTQGVPTNDPNYYNQLQQYYNSYLPQTPRDVVTPLQQWYNSKSGA
jgi:hypothetical protein